MKTPSLSLQRRARVGARIAGAASLLLIASLGSVSAKGKPPRDDPPPPEPPAEATVAYEVTWLPGFGGNWTTISDVNSAGIAVGTANEVEAPEKIFDRHWGINLLQCAMDRMEESYAGRGQEALFAAIKPVLGLDGASVRYQDIAEQLDSSESAIKVAAHRLRKRFRRTLKEEIALTLDDESEEAIEEEIRHLFGVFAG
jgi:hypothetical protein